METMEVKTCTVEGCDKPLLARGWCRMHYNRAYRIGAGIQTRKPVECGTVNGYHRHRRVGEESCQPCKTASADYNRKRRAKLRPAPKPKKKPVKQDTPHCQDCTRPMVGRSTTKAHMPDGWRRKHNDTTCTACYDKARRERKAAEEAQAQKPVLIDPALDAMMRARRERLARQQRLAQLRRPAA